jgi:hypothetical protein
MRLTHAEAYTAPETPASFKKSYPLPGVAAIGSDSPTLTTMFADAVPPSTGVTPKSD